MTTDFSKVYPWSGITPVTIDGQAMIKIPKFYYRTGVLPSTAKYAGKKFWQVSEKKGTDFKCHPAFMYNGQEKDCFYTAAYEAYNTGSNVPGSAANKTPWVNITTTNAKAYSLLRNDNTGAGEKAGWHMENVFEKYAKAMLMLIEIGSPDAQTKIGNGNYSSSACVATGTTNAVYRGIHEMWADAWEETDGLKMDASGHVQVWDDQGVAAAESIKNKTAYTEPTYMSTGIGTASGWITDVSDVKGTNWDLSPLFIPVSADGTQSNGTFGDYCWPGSNTVLYYGGSWYHGTRGGAFTFSVDNAASNSSSNVGFRLAKYDI